MTPLLEVHGLTVDFGGLKALRGVDLGVAEGAIHGLVGPNGAGKSTLVNALTGVVRPTQGQIRYFKPIEAASAAFRSKFLLTSQWVDIIFRPRPSRYSLKALGL